MSSPAELAEFPLVLPWPVQWGDQDAFAHVNNAVYFRWFESARIAYLDRIRMDALYKHNQVGPILAAINCNFRRAVNYPDTVKIGARVTRLGRSSFAMQHCLYSEAQGAVAADGDSTIVVYNYATNQPQPIPDELRAAIEKLEGRTF